MRQLCLILLLLGGCRAVSPAAGALLNVGMASGVGAARVAEGDCFTICAPGTACNLKTRLCDPLPCHDQCGSDERCDTSGPLEHCVAAPGLQIRQDRPGSSTGSFPVGLVPPLSPSPPSSPARTDVPLAQ